MHHRQGSPCSLSRSPSPPAHVPNRISAAGLAHAVWNARGADGRVLQGAVELPEGTIALPPIERGSRSGRASGSAAAALGPAHFERLDLLRLELEDRNEHQEGGDDDAAWDEAQDDSYLDLRGFERSGGGDDDEDDNDDEDDEDDDDDDDDNEILTARVQTCCRRCMFLTSRC